MLTTDKKSRNQESELKEVIFFRIFEFESESIMFSC